MFDLRSVPAAALLLSLLAAPAVAAPDGRLSVVDADTIDVGGARVRLFGIDAPELSQICGESGATWACGTWAASEARRRWEGQEARCEPLDTDRYGRIVARCHVGSDDIARVMVAEGIALAYRDYSWDYDLEEKQAATLGRGLWSGAFESPAEYRAGQAAAQEAMPQGASGDCAIKGNISSNGRIYHMPGQDHYDRTRIDEGAGERWFCSAAEAEAAGWRAARR
ncbi:thermonuclease family protein [Wenxinia saemankumensis]|uniref:Endonuclease YncB, thermonuclease family n=1 Tax=Wenxinia saemankumensis TaxID=1447782 RepID=A0A1M6AQX1_9RHOB|nr:thermonuclease family protein [Wenxinia saemankumensis]SHI38866.1 Endonuclease YncB, thermonuclease family [Wenxinia saemankumensis]